MQAASDPLLGWYHIDGFDGGAHDFYVRQLWDGKASIDVSQLGPAGLVAYGESCGWTLARGHARSGDRVAMAAYLGDEPIFEQAVAAFSRAYADTNEGDHQRLGQAIEAGELVAEAGV
jgi:sugar/nucleoside kinase (ribokinase family)